MVDRDRKENDIVHSPGRSGWLEGQTDRLELHTKGTSIHFVGKNSFVVMTEIEFSKNLVAL